MLVEPPKNAVLTTPVARLSVCLVIGILLLGPKRGAAQEKTSAAIVAVSKNDPAFGKRLNNLFKINAPDWAEGFELALGMGESVVPPLAHKLITEKNQERRLLWIAAYGLAARAPQKFYASLRLKGAERSLAMFALAIGPIQADGETSVRRMLAANADAAEVIATCLALARFEDRTQGVPKKLLASQDPGELGSALYVNPSMSPQEIKGRLAGMRAKSAHVDLVWRGYYLATARTVAEERALPGRREAALAALASAASKTRKAAALLLARGGAGHKLTEEVIQGLDDETAVILALSPAMRPQLRTAGRLPPEPSPTQSRDEIRRRQVVLFACSAPLPALHRAIAKWPKTCSDLMDEICLALAFRISKNARDRKALAGTLDKLGRADGGSGAFTEAGLWLRLAQHLALPANVSRTAGLSRPLRLAFRGALSDTVRANVVERILWKRGSHPGLSGLELHRAFVFDLLLAHAEAAGGQPEPYVPKGMLATGNDFLQVVNRLFKFVSTREPWALREYRLSL